MPSPSRRPEEIYGKIYIMDNDDPDKILYYYNIKSQDLAIAIQKAEGLDITEEEPKLFNNKDEVLNPKWDRATILYIKDKDIPRVITKSRGVATCAFSASKAYIESILGGSLGSDDREWYVQHHLVTLDGLPQEHSFTVIQQLVEPYNIGISRIVVPPGTRRFDSYIPFIKSLGCNPYFLVDGMTSNQKALEMMFPDPVERAKHAKTFLDMWRFECAEEPLKPAILMCQFETRMQGHNGGSTFRSPRSKYTGKDWVMSIQLDRLHNIKYLEPLVLPEYQEWAGSFNYEFWQIKDKNGDTLREIDRRNWKSNWQPTVVYHGGSAAPLPPTPEVAETRIALSAQGSEKEWWETIDWEKLTDAEAEAVLRNQGYLAPEEKLSEKTQDKTKESKKPEFEYPPVCETCQRNPGQLFYTNKASGKQEKHCQHCGTLQEKNYQEIDWNNWSPRGYQKTL